MRFAIIALLRLGALWGQSALVSTLVGGGTPQYPFTAGVPGPNAAIYRAAGIAADSFANVFVADLQTNRILRVDHATGATTIYAGTGVAGTGGDGGPAIAAQFDGPVHLAVDAADNLYVFEDRRIRRVDRATGIISTFAVTNYGTSIGALGPEAPTPLPTGKMAFDPAGNLLCAIVGQRHPDFGDGGVFRIDAKTGAIQKLVGGGTANSADGAPALSVYMSSISVQVDSAGNIYFSSTNNHIWKLPAGSDRLVNLAGTGQFGNSGDGGPGTSATVFQPSDLALDSSGGLFFASSTVVRRLDLRTGIVNAVQPKNGATPYSFFSTQLLAETPSGDLLVRDGFANRILRYLPATGAIVPLAGNGQRVYIPDVVTDWSSFPSVISDMAIHPDGSLFIAADSRIFQANWQTGALRRVVGTGLRAYSGDGGPALQATLGGTLRLYPNAAGDLYVGDSDSGRIRRIDGHTGVITSVVSGVGGFFFVDPSSICGPAVDRAGNVFFATFGAYKIFRADALTGNVTVYAGDGSLKTGVDGTPAKGATLEADCPWLVDSLGNLYFSDASVLRSIDAQTGLLNTVVQLAPTGLTRTLSGDFYFTGVSGDTSFVTPSNPFGAGTQIGFINGSTKAISLINRRAVGDSGDGGVASTAQFSRATSLGLDPSGNLLIASNDRIRKLSLVAGSEPVFGPVNIVNAASLRNAVSPNCWASLFGDRLAGAQEIADSASVTELGGTYLQIVDSKGVVFKPVLQFVGPSQVNFLVPPDAAAGPAQVSVVRQGVESAKQPLTIQSQAPGLSSADSSGTGVAAGYAVYVYSDGSQQTGLLYKLVGGQIAFNPTPVPDSGPSLYLSLFGTGWTNVSPDSVTASVGGLPVPVVFIGPQGDFPGLDQINIGPLPASLKQNPGAVDIVFTVGNTQVNIVQVGVF